MHGSLTPKQPWRNAAKRGGVSGRDTQRDAKPRRTSGRVRERSNPDILFRTKRRTVWPSVLQFLQFNDISSWDVLPFFSSSCSPWGGRSSGGHSWRGEIRWARYIVIVLNCTYTVCTATSFWLTPTNLDEIRQELHTVNLKAVYLHSFYICTLSIVRWLAAFPYISRQCTEACV